VLAFWKNILTVAEMDAVSEEDAANILKTEVR
jgi:hypothetical protein